MAKREKEEIERIQKALKKTEMSIISTCVICNHPAYDKITEVYFELNKVIPDVITWFKSTFDKEIKEKKWEIHFREHVDPFVTEYSVIRKKKLNELRIRAVDSHQDNSLRFNLIKQIAWEFMIDIFANKEEKLDNKEKRIDHQKISKQFVELAKMYREYYQMELEMIGMGKTEQEQKKIMEEFVAGMIKQAIKAVADYPEAQDKLKQFLTLNIEGNVEKEVVVESESESESESEKEKENEE